MTLAEEGLSSQSQQIDNVKAAVAYVEDGNTASRTYTAGQFVLWKGLLYTVKPGGLPQNETISTTYLEAVTGGGFNVLSGAIDDLASKIQYQIINISDYSSFNDIYNILKNKIIAIGGGSIGNREDTQLKTILPNPTGFANYTAVSIQIVGDKIMHATAIGLYNCRLADCYIFKDTEWLKTDWAIKK